MPVTVKLGNGATITLAGNAPVVALQPRARILAQKNLLAYTVVKNDGTTVDVPLAVIEALYEPFAVTNTNASGLMAPAPAANAVAR